MAGCKRCALKGEKGKGKKKRKEKEKEEKMGIKIVLFFSYAQWSFFKYIRKTVSRLSRSYPLLFAIKILMVSQLETFKSQICTPTPILATFSNISGRPKDIADCLEF